MRRESGITIVTLAITIIVLGILIAVGVTALTGDNGIIISTKQSKENLEATQREEEEKVNLLYEQLNEYDAQFQPDVESSIEKVENELLEFKRTIANYIEEAGGVKPATTEDKVTFRESILGIVAEVTKDATATASDIKEGKTAYVNGNKITGTLVTNNVATGYYVSSQDWGTTHTFSNLSFTPYAILIAPEYVSGSSYKCYIYSEGDTLIYYTNYGSSTSAPTVTYSSNSVEVFVPNYYFRSGTPVHYIILSEDCF